MCDQSGIAQHSKTGMAVDAVSFQPTPHHQQLPMSGGHIPDLFDFVEPVRPSADLIGQTIADVERHLILMTLEHCLGNRTHAARILGISVRTLRNKLNEYMNAGIAVPQPSRAHFVG